MKYSFGMKRLILIFALCGLLLPSAYGGSVLGGILQAYSESGEKINISFSDGSKYVGQIKNGKAHGQGTKTWADGTKYIGEYKDNKFHGQGTKTNADGSKYVGEWKDDKVNGQGTFTWGTGEKYVGEWKDNKFHGQGTKTNADGSKYVGEWKNGQRHGDGVDYSKSGRIVGEWKMNHPWNAVVISSSGDFLGKFVNGAPQRQNQGLTQSQLMELLLLSKLLERDRNASQRAYDWGRSLFGGGGFTCNTRHLGWTSTTTCD